MAKPAARKDKAAQERREHAACLGGFLRRLARDPEATWEVWEPFYRTAESTAALIARKREADEAAAWLRRQLATLTSKERAEQ